MELLTKSNAFRSKVNGRKREIVDVNKKIEKLQKKQEYMYELMHFGYAYCISSI